MSALPEEAPADIGEQRLSPAILEILPGQDETTREKWLFSPVFVRLLATNAAFGFSVSTFYLFKDVDPRDRTWLAGLSNGVLQLGMLSVSLFGALANHTGFDLVFILAGALVAASSVLLMPVALRRLVRGCSLSTEMPSPLG